MDWGQTIATIVSVVAVGVALLAYITRQFNRIGDQLGTFNNRLQNVEKQQVSFNERFDRIDDRFDQIDHRFAQIDGQLKSLKSELLNVRKDLQKLEIAQARMLGYLEGRGVMDKATVDAELAS